MGIDKFVFHLVILLIPGFLGITLERKYKSTGKTLKRFEGWFDLIDIIALSILSILLYDLILQIINKVFRQTFEYVFPKITSEDKYFTYTEFIILTGINCLLGMLKAYAYNYKWFYKLGKRIKITKHFGDEDVWSFLHNSDDINWIYFRDYVTKQTYFGYIELFSDSGEKRELVISDCLVYDSDSGDLLYNLDKVYISRLDSEFSLEIPRSIIEKEISTNVNTTESKSSKASKGRKRKETRK